MKSLTLATEISIRYVCSLYGPLEPIVLGVLESVGQDSPSPVITILFPLQSVKWVDGAYFTNLSL